MITFVLAFLPTTVERSAIWSDILREHPLHEGEHQVVRRECIALSMVAVQRLQRGKGGKSPSSQNNSLKFARQKMVSLTGQIKRLGLRNCARVAFSACVTRRQRFACNPTFSVRFRYDHGGQFHTPCLRNARDETHRAVGTAVWTDAAPPRASRYCVSGHACTSQREFAYM